jgi:hypothetical protein
LTGRRLGDRDLDRLLRAVLSEDLTPEAEKRLRRSLHEGWHGLGERSAAPEERSWAAAPSFAIPHVVLGTVACLLLALGLALNLAMPPRVVAASLSVQNQSLRLQRQLGRAVAMRGEAVTTDGKDRTLRYRFEWRTPDEAHVWVEEAGGHAEWVVREEDEPGDPRLGAVRPLLSPARIERLLAGRWTFVADDLAAGRTRFDVTGARGLLRVEVDRVTGLPVRLEAGFMVTLTWQLPAEAPLSLSQAARRSGEGEPR